MTGTDAAYPPPLVSPRSQNPPNLPYPVDRPPLPIREPPGPSRSYPPPAPSPRQLNVLGGTHHPVPQQNAPRAPPPRPRKPDTLRNRDDQAKEIQHSGEDITFTKNDIIIAIMGVTGAGKSTFISLLSDAEIEIGHGLQSCTTKVGVYYFRHRGTRVFLIDTPGFDDTNRSDSEVLKDVAFWLAAAYKKEAQLAGIIYLHRISDQRMAGSALRNLRMFMKLCGSKNLSSVVLATTHWKNAEGVPIPENVGNSRMKELVETEDFWGGMVRRGSRALRHDGSRESALQIIAGIVNRDDRVILDIQTQLVDQHMNLDDTSAAQALQSELLAERKKFQERLSELKDDMEFAIREKDEHWQKQIKADQAKYKSEVEKTHAETAALRTNLQKIAKEKDEQFRQLQEEMARQQKQYQDEIRQTSEALKAAQEEQQRRAEDYERQRKEDAARAAQVARDHKKSMTDMEARMRKEGNAEIFAQMKREREESERRFQQQREDDREAAREQAARWEAQQEADRQRQQLLMDQREEADRRLREIEREQKRSKGFLLDAVKAVCNVASLGLALTGRAPFVGFWH